MFPHDAERCHSSRAAPRQVDVVVRVWSSGWSVDQLCSSRHAGKYFLRNFFFSVSCCLIKANSDRNSSFTIDLAPNEILFGVDSVGKSVITILIWLRLTHFYPPLRFRN